MTEERDYVAQVDTSYNPNPHHPRHRQRVRGCATCLYGCHNRQHTGLWQTTNYPKENRYTGTGAPKAEPQAPGYGLIWGKTHTNQTQGNTGPLSLEATNMTHEDIDCPIKDAREANAEIHIRDSNGKVFQNNFESPTRGEEEEEISKIDETSDLELLSNLSSSTEVEQETKEHNLRRSK